MSRVGQRYKQRSQCNQSRDYRLIQVEGVVWRLTQSENVNSVTMTQVARCLGLKPSSYVMNMLNELAGNGKVKSETKLASNGVSVRHWSHMDLVQGKLL